MTFVRPVQVEKADSPMVVTPSGIVNVRQAGAGVERPIPNARDVVAYDEAVQAVAGIELRVANAGHAGGNRDAGQIGAAG